MKLRGAAKEQKLLVIGTQPAVLISLRTMLNLGRVHVLATDEPEVAIRLVETSQSEVGLALIDVCTIDMEPRMLADRLRAVQPEIQILFFSSLVDGEVIRLGIVDGPGGVLRQEGVVQAIEAALEEKDRPAKPEVLKTLTAGSSFDYL
jgi:DNA-binding NarL/FixJ family response regulator